MTRHIAVGIDIGSYQIKVVVAETDPQTNTPHIIGTGIAESKGLRHGYIMNSGEVVRSIKKAVALAEKTSGVQIKKAFLAVGGVGLASTTCQGAVMVSRGDSEVTDLDVKKVQEVCEQDIPPSLSLNRKIIHTIPIAYRIDGKTVMGRPQGMKGLKLENRTLFISALEQHLNDLIAAVGEAGIIVEDVMAAPIAASLVTLNKAQKIAGVVLANIGAETVSIVVFENNLPISLEVFPIGSNDITNDIALGLKIPLEEAEKVKTGKTNTYPRKKLEEIIGARLSDIFELIDTHLRKINRNGLLPAGIVITGGGSGTSSIEDQAKSSLKLPSRIADLVADGAPRTQIKDSTWSVAYGLCIFGLNAGDHDGYRAGNIIKFNKIWQKAWKWVQQFLP
jgi:cell division protein FtsA